MSHPREVAPEIDRAAFLDGAQFVDAFCLETTEPNLKAPVAARRMMSRSPPWVAALMRIRNRAVAPLGLKAPVAAVGARDRIGMFPVLSVSDERVVVGLDDRHLDFRLVVDLSVRGERRAITATTLVRTHNWLGRSYLAISCRSTVSSRRRC